MYSSGNDYINIITPFVKRDKFLPSKQNGIIESSKVKDSLSVCILQLLPKYHIGGCKGYIVFV
jgi:hypothetical protein